jgi:hypothetical protein
MPWTILKRKKKHWKKLLKTRMLYLNNSSTGQSKISPHILHPSTLNRTPPKFYLPLTF